MCWYAALKPPQQSRHDSPHLQRRAPKPGRLGHSDRPPNGPELTLPIEAEAELKALRRSKPPTD